MGPVWDFDLGAGNNPDAQALRDPHGWWTLEGPWLGRMRYADPAFRQELADAWAGLEADLDAVPDLVDSMATSLACAQQSDYARWHDRTLPSAPGEAASFHQASVEELEEWLRARTDWLDEQLLPAERRPPSGPPRGPQGDLLFSTRL